MPGKFSFLGKPVSTISQTMRIFNRGQMVFNDDSMPQGRAARLVTLRLQKGEKAAKHLKDLRGSLIGLVQTPSEELVRIDNLARAVGEQTAGVGGASLKVLEATKTDEGLYQLRFLVVSPPRGAEDGSVAMSSARAD